MLLERQTQLKQLEAALAVALQGHGRVVALTGEAGAGKTALVEAFASRLDGDLTVLRSACEDLSIPDPLGPLYDLAREVQWELPRAIDDRRGASAVLVFRGARRLRGKGPEPARHRRSALGRRRDARFRAFSRQAYCKHPHPAADHGAHRPQRRADARTPGARRDPGRQCRAYRRAAAQRKCRAVARRGRRARWRRYLPRERRQRLLRHGAACRRRRWRVAGERARRRAGARRKTVAGRPLDARRRLGISTPCRRLGAERPLRDCRRRPACRMRLQRPA
ncbi:ATP-binding protein [Mesorhizobium atlanticum]